MSITPFFIDSMYTSLSPEQQDLIADHARMEADRAVASMQAKAEKHIKDHVPSGVILPMTLPNELSEDGSQEEYNVALTQAHPQILKVMFMMGFTQGFCFLHRFNACKEAMTDYLENAIEVEEGPDSDDADMWRHMESARRYATLMGIDLGSDEEEDGDKEPEKPTETPAGSAEVHADA